MFQILLCIKFHEDNKRKNCIVTRLSVSWSEDHVDPRLGVEAEKTGQDGNERTVLEGPKS